MARNPLLRVSWPIMMCVAALVIPAGAYDVAAGDDKEKSPARERATTPGVNTPRLGPGKSNAGDQRNRDQTPRDPAKIRGQNPGPNDGPRKVDTRKVDPGKPGTPGVGRPGVNDPGAPGVGRLGVGRPGVNDPGAPGVGRPGVGRPGVNDPGAPGVGRPGVGRPGVNDPGAPGVGRPGVGRPGVGRPGVDPGPPGVGRPGVNDPGAPGVGRPGVGRPGVDVGRPGVDPGAPGVGRPGVGVGRPGVDVGRPGVNDPGAPGVGRPGVGRPGVDVGRPGVDPGAPGVGRPGVGVGRPGVDPGAPGVGRPGVGVGRPGVDVGRPGVNDPGAPGIGRPGRPGDRPVVKLPDGVRPTIPTRIDRNGLIGGLDKDGDLLKDLNRVKRARDPGEIDRVFDRLKDSPDFVGNARLNQIKVDNLSGNFQRRVRSGDVTRVVNNININNTVIKQVNLTKQYNLAIHGDVARQLNLGPTLIAGGGWGKRPVGIVSPAYTKNHFSIWYPGPAWGPAHCWYPHWNTPWVAWSFWDTVLPIYDPRPIICQPVIYDPCPVYVPVPYPVWQPLPIVTCGTWVDVPPVVVQTGVDVQLLAVRFVDAGHPENNQGPRYRAWVRNNTAQPIAQPFNAVLLASIDLNATPELPQAGVTIPSLQPGETLPFDVRLPLVVNRMNRSPEGHQIPFTMLHVLVDSHRELPDVTPENNGLVIARTDIAPVDPVAFSTDVSAAAPGSLVSLAGEGLGPEPGQVYVVVDGVSTPAEIHGWYDLGVYLQLPPVRVVGPTSAQIIVVRGDGAATNPVEVTIAPEQLLGEAPLPLPIPAQP